MAFCLPWPAVGRDTARVERRFREAICEARLGAGGSPLLVGVSGGADSVVLLFLLRFAAPGLKGSLVAAHLDHAMREGSDADSDWVAGLCRAWRIPLERDRLTDPPRGESEARVRRHAFLRETARRTGADVIVLAHHADDQAETVLFRALRGTGIDGLRGMPLRSPAGLVRPLLPFWRAELRDYALTRRLRWREDPSNAGRDARRNRLRNELLPWIETEVAPGARRSLVRLARLADEAVRDAAPALEQAEQVVLSERNGVLLLARDALRDYSCGFAARLLRRVMRRFGIVLDRAGTRTALQFITGAPSGRSMVVGGGVLLTIEFDRARLEPLPPSIDHGLPLRIEGLHGEGRLVVGGVAYRVHWQYGAPVHAVGGNARWQTTVDTGGATPLLRGWQPGDRVRTPAGSRKLKKLFNDRRVPLTERSRWPVLARADGSVLWVPGLAPPTEAELYGPATLFISISDDR
jgi:tRNA(Ile)-lysidine synthase